MASWEEGLRYSIWKMGSNACREQISEPPFLPEVIANEPAERRREAGEATA